MTLWRIAGVKKAMKNKQSILTGGNLSRARAYTNLTRVLFICALIAIALGTIGFVVAAMLKFTAMAGACAILAVIGMALFWGALARADREKGAWA